MNQENNNKGGVWTSEWSWRDKDTKSGFDVERLELCSEKTRE